MLHSLYGTQWNQLQSRYSCFLMGSALPVISGGTYGVFSGTLCSLRDHPALRPRAAGAVTAPNSCEGGEVRLRKSQMNCLS